MGVALLSVGEWLGLTAGLLGLVLATVQGWVLVHLLTQNGRLLIRLEGFETQARLSGEPPRAPQTLAGVGLPIGATAPTFSLPGLHGEILTLDNLRTRGGPVLLIFSNPGCGPCISLLPEIGRWQREHAGRLTVAILSYGDPEASRVTAMEHRLASVLLLKDRAIAEAYGSDGTPDAVLIHPNGTIDSGLAMGTEAIRDLVASATSDGAPSLQPHMLSLRVTGRKIPA